LTIIKNQMPTYLAYELDEKGHVVGPPVIIVALIDTDALTHAKHWIDGRDLEFWDETRAWVSLSVVGANRRLFLAVRWKAPR
jgi:hypothetical protein